MQIMKERRSVGTHLNFSKVVSAQIKLANTVILPWLYL